MKRGLIVTFIIATLLFSFVGVFALEQKGILVDSCYICYGPEGSNSGPRKAVLTNEDTINYYCSKEVYPTILNFKNIQSEEDCEKERQNQMGKLFSSGFKGETYAQYLDKTMQEASGVLIASAEERSENKVIRGAITEGVINLFSRITNWFKNFL